MRDLALSANTHDLAFAANGDLILIGDAEQVAQQIKCRLKFFLGEWFLDTRKGVPYLERILVKNPNLNHIRAIFKTQISTVPGVKSVDSFSMSLDRQSRSLTIEYEATTIYGLVTRKEILEYV